MLVLDTYGYSLSSIFTVTVQIPTQPTSSNPPPNGTHNPDYTLVLIAIFSGAAVLTLILIVAARKSTK